MRMRKWKLLLWTQRGNLFYSSLLVGKPQIYLMAFWEEEKKSFSPFRDYKAIWKRPQARFGRLQEDHVTPPTYTMYCYWVTTPSKMVSEEKIDGEKKVRKKEKFPFWNKNCGWSSFSPTLQFSIVNAVTWKQYFFYFCRAMNIKYCSINIPSKPQTLCIDFLNKYTC